MGRAMCQQRIGTYGQSTMVAVSRGRAKLLPASVVKQFADDRAKLIEENEGRKVGRKEMRELREAMTIELLPRAFIRRRTTYGWIDPVNGWLVIYAAAPAKAEEFLEHLRKLSKVFRHGWSKLLSLLQAQ